MKINKTEVNIIQGDITEQGTEAIVNSANPRLTPGGGISGKIHQKAGIQLAFDLNDLIKKTKIGFLETGDTIISHGGNLKSHYIIHTVGPKYTVHGNNWTELLKKCYTSCLNIALREGIKSISFPSISTGIYGCPIKEASIIAIDTIKSFVMQHTDINEIRIVLYSGDDFAIYNNLLN